MREDVAEKDEVNGDAAEAGPAEGAAEPVEAIADAETAEREAAAAPKVVDKRRLARLLGFGFGASGQSSDVDAEPVRERLPSYVEELKERAERVQAEARAETEAAKARLERHYESRIASARADVIATMLPVFDNLERALAVPGAEESPLYEGVAATRDEFLRKLKDLGAEPVAGVGEPFDPEVHEAVDTVEVDNAALDGSITEVLRRGFRLGDRLVRPSIVRVGRYAGSSAGLNSG